MCVCVYNSALAFKCYTCTYSIVGLGSTKGCNDPFVASDIPTQSCADDHFCMVSIVVLCELVKYQYFFPMGNQQY